LRLDNLEAETEVARAILSTVRWRSWLVVRRGTMARATGRRGKWVRGWRGSVKLLKEEKEGQKVHQGGGSISTESSPEAAMATGLALGCA
jgi:hypothetical protein